MREFTCNQSVKSISTVRRFGRRIQRYILTYLGIENTKTKQADGSLAHFYKLEKLVKVYKS